MEPQLLVMEFINHTGASKEDAITCLKSWEWDLKKALIDYNGIFEASFIQYHFRFLIQKHKI